MPTQHWYGRNSIGNPHLGTAGVFDRWVASWLWQFKSGNRPDKRDVLGTLLLAGRRHYAHGIAWRGDAAGAQALGAAKIVSKNTLRGLLARIDEAASSAWLRPSLIAAANSHNKHVRPGWPAERRRGACMATAPTPVKRR